MATVERLQAKDLSGIICPVVIPLAPAEDGRAAIAVDVRSQDRLIDILLDEGVHSIFLGSNAGEGRSIDSENWKASVREGIASVRRRSAKIPVVVGVLRKDPDEVIRLSKYSKDVGADALVYAPLYTETEPRVGIERIIRETGMSVILYNNPEFTGNQNIPFAFVRFASRLENVIGIKDTSRDSAYFARLLTLRKSGSFRVFQGHTKAAYLTEQLGSIDGMVPVEANIIGEQLVGTWISGSTSQLRGALNAIEAEKADFGGTTKYIKHQLKSAGIFASEQMYST